MHYAVLRMCKVELLTLPSSLEASTSYCPAAAAELPRHLGGGAEGRAGQAAGAVAGQAGPARRRAGAS